MSRIALLVSQTPTLEDGNYLRLAAALAKLGHDIHLMPIDSIRLVNGRVQADGFRWDDSPEAGPPFPDLSPAPLNQDLAWVLSLGERRNFLDKVQLLRTLPTNVCVINALDAIMHLNSKYLLASRPEIFPCPETHASPNASELAGIISEKGGRWIIKPPAGSLGRDVFLVNAGDDNIMSILRHLCGPTNTGYTLIQRYVSEIERGEKRVLIAAGRIIGQYRRLPTIDHRTNVTQGAATEPCDLTRQERDYCQQLGRELMSRGVVYSGIDLAYPWLIEVNVINPGGLMTIDELTGVNHAGAVANAVDSALLSR